MSDKKRTKKKQSPSPQPREIPQPGVVCQNPECREPIARHSRICVVCGSDAGFPNVRASQEPNEKIALDKRLRAAQADAEQRGCGSHLEDFRQAVNQSRAVLCRPIGKVAELLSSDNELYTTFYQSVESWARMPEDNEWDRGRGSVDALLFPHYHQEIRFAALSLDGQGMTGYGGLTMILSEVAIRARATVFEKNTIQFCRDHQVLAGGTAPSGYRAEWNDRGTLAAAKLYAKIAPETTADEFNGILMDSSGATTADFIEVHIYGPLHRRAITKVIGKVPQRHADKVLLKSISAKLEAINIQVVSVP